MKNGYFLWLIGLIALGAFYAGIIPDDWMEAPSLWQIILGLGLLYVVNTIGDEFRRLKETASELSKELSSLRSELSDLEDECEEMKDRCETLDERCDLLEEALEDAGIDIPSPPIPMPEPLANITRRPIIIARR